MCEICLALAPPTHAGPANRPQPAPQPGPPVPPHPPAPSTPVGLGRLWVVHWRAYVCTREKVLPASLLDRESAKKFALCAQIGPNSAFLCVLGELFRGRAAGGAVPGELFRVNVTGGVVLGEFFRANRCCAQYLWATRRTSGWLRWGFCTTRSLLTACRRRVGPPCSAIPPDWRRRGRESKGGWPPKCRPIGRKSRKMACFG